MPPTGYNEADAQRERATTLREQAKALRKDGKATKAGTLLPDIKAADKAAREASAKAQTIDDAGYDPKAVNPRERKVVDTRTPAQLLDAIAEKGKEVEAALTRLRALL
jgi:hypothetical protein